MREAFQISKEEANVQKDWRSIGNSRCCRSDWFL